MTADVFSAYTEHYSADQLAANVKLKDNNRLTYSPWMKVATVRGDKASISYESLIWSVLSGSMGVCAYACEGLPNVASMKPTGGLIVPDISYTD